MKQDFLNKNYMDKTIETILNIRSEMMPKDAKKKKYALVRQLLLDDVKSADTYLSICIIEGEENFSINTVTFERNTVKSESSFVIGKNDSITLEMEEWLEFLKKYPVCIWGSSEILQSVLSHFGLSVDAEFIDVSKFSDKEELTDAKEIGLEFFNHWTKRKEKQRIQEEKLKEILNRNKLKETWAN